MDWLKRINGALDYIEGQLTGKIDFKKAAEISCCSVYHFQRMFSFMADIPLSEYIRRRRLTLAAFELQQSNIKVIDLAFQYGYESPEAFTRAFQKMHGVSPTIARQKGINLKSYPRLSFHFAIRGAEEMNYKMIEKDAFSVFGIEKVFSTEEEEKLKLIPEMWGKAMRDGTIERIGKATGEYWDDSKRGIMPVKGMIGYREEKEGYFPYMICGNMPESGLVDTEAFTVLEIPSLTWAVFTTDEHTPEQKISHLQTLWKRIYTEWLPMSSYEIASGPQFELNGVAEGGKVYSEAWIPVTHQNNVSV